jgi:pyruvate/2-oxoacid:ferredoxin oxidoreductase beta subunit
MSDEPKKEYHECVTTFCPGCGRPALVRLVDVEAAIAEGSTVMIDGDGNVYERDK